MFINERREFVRCSVKVNSTCMLQFIESKKTFCATILDYSSRGIRFRLDTDESFMGAATTNYDLRVLSCAQGENTTFNLTWRVLRMVWQEGRILGCHFIDGLTDTDRSLPLEGQRHIKAEVDDVCDRRSPV